MPAGRPSKYSESYCNELIEKMAGGTSIASFAASIGVARDTISEWANVHPEFSAAVKIGKAKCAAWWEERLKVIAQTGGAPGQATATIFGLKNMASDDWREINRTEVTGKDGAPVEVAATQKFDASTLKSDEALEAMKMLALAMKATEKKA